MKRRKKATLLALSLASFFNDVGSDMIFPIWPFFVISIIGANMAILGFVDGLGKALVSISQAVGGYISDRIKKRKLFVWTGYLCGSIARIGYALSPSWHYLIPFKIIDRGGKVRGAPRDAILAEISTKKDRGRNFGILRAMDNLGAVVGILICMLLVGFLPVRKIFLIAALPSLLSALLIYLSIKEVKTGKLYKKISFRGLTKNYMIFLLCGSFLSLATFSYSFLLIFVKELGFQIVTMPLFYLIFTFFAFLSSTPFGILADKIGRKKVIAISIFIYMLMCIGFLMVKSFWLLFVLFIFYGLYKGGIETSQRTFVSELCTKELRATALGGYQMVTGLVALPSSVIAGFLWTKIGSFSIFIFAISLCILALLTLIFVKEKFNK